MTGVRIGTRKVAHSSLLSGSAMFSVLTALLYPFFEKQIKAGGPVTITSPDIIRYFMAIPEAASLVLQAAAIAKGGELFILDMVEPVKIKDLAERMIRLYGTGEERIEYVGLRPGEKMYEELLLDKENDRATEKERIYVTEQERISEDEIEEKLKVLETTIEQHKDVKMVLKEIVETYHAEGETGTQEKI